MLLIIMVAKKKLCSEKVSMLDRLQRILYFKYLSIVLEPTIVDLEQPTPSFHRTIDSFTPAECNLFFRFQQRDLHRLVALLHFPRRVVFDNGAVLPGEEVMLRGLYELVSGMDKVRISKHVFGQHPTLQTRAFTWFINHIYSNFKHIVTDNLEWWQRNGFMDKSVEAVRQKMTEVLLQRYGSRNVLEVVMLQQVGLFIDCNCFPTSVVGGGPAEKGANAARWADDVQRSFYNMWKSQHGLKHQTVDNVYGITVDMFGPTSLRRNDNTLLAQSNLVNRLAAVGETTAMGDSAYTRMSNLTTYYKGDQGDVEIFNLWNKGMKSVRVSIEWNYGYTATLFKYLQTKSKLRVMASENVSRVYTVATILRNCVAALYGCQTSNYFNVTVDELFLEKYLIQSDY